MGKVLLQQHIHNPCEPPSPGHSPSSDPTTQGASLSCLSQILQGTNNSAIPSASCLQVPCKGAASENVGWSPEEIPKSSSPQSLSRCVRACICVRVCSCECTSLLPVYRCHARGMSVRMWTESPELPESSPQSLN